MNPYIHIPYLLLRNVNVCDGPPGRRIRRVVIVEAVALHGVGHAHGHHLAFVEAGVAGRLGVELFLHAPVEVPYALNLKNTENIICYSLNIL